MPAFNLPSATAYIVITALTGTIYTILVWFIRLFIRLKINPPFAWDDVHCTIATIFTIVDASLVLIQTGYGLGHHSDTITARASNIQRIFSWITVLCYVQATCFALLSVTFLLVRVTKFTTHARPAYILAFATGLWCLTSTTIILFQCRLPEPWRTRPHSRCIDIYAAWQFITISRSLLEFGNVVIAGWLLWKLQMPIKPKVSIIALFALRLLVIPPALTRLHYIEVSWKAADWSYARINVQIITQVCLHVSTILATVPCVKNFLLVFESGNLHSRAPQTAASSHRVSKRQSSVYALHSAPAPMSRRPKLQTLRHAISEFDMRHPPPTAILPGPLHTLRMNSWSAPGLSTIAATPAIELKSTLSIGAMSPTTISTAEHDPVDARVAAMERRMSTNSEDSRKRIKRTQSYIVEIQDQRTGAEDSVQRRDSGKRERPGGSGTRQRSSVGSCWSVEDGLQVKEDKEGCIVVSF